MNAVFSKTCNAPWLQRTRNLILLAMLMARRPILAQGSPDQTELESPEPAVAMTLPDAPQPSFIAHPLVDQPLPFAGGAPQVTQVPVLADRFAKYIEPGQTAVKLSGFDKVLLGARHATSSFAAATWFVSAGYEQVLNSRPNYGETFKGYTQRLGAAAAHNVSEGLFSDSVLATVLHEDPRYYKLGPGHPLNERLVHALLHPLVTRTDGGARTINFAQIGGNLAGAGLTDAYYPSINRTAGATLITFGTSMGGGALGYLFNEFLSIHLPVSR